MRVLRTRNWAYAMSAALLLWACVDGEDDDGTDQDGVAGAGGSAGLGVGGRSGGGRAPSGGAGAAPIGGSAGSTFAGTGVGGNGEPRPPGGAGADSGEAGIGGGGAPGGGGAGAGHGEAGAAGGPRTAAGTSGGGAGGDAGYSGVGGAGGADPSPDATAGSGGASSPGTHRLTVSVLNSDAIGEYEDPDAPNAYVRLHCVYTPVPGDFDQPRTCEYDVPVGAWVWLYSDQPGGSFDLVGGTSPPCIYEGGDGAPFVECGFVMEAPRAVSFVWRIGDSGG